VWLDFSLILQRRPGRFLLWVWNVVVATAKVVSCVVEDVGFG
jgi:hypothetical protein